MEDTTTAKSYPVDVAQVVAPAIPYKPKKEEDDEEV